MQPPTTLAWPSMYLVVEWVTMSQPNSKGRQRTGVGKVLSMTRGTLWAWAMLRQSLDVADDQRRVGHRLAKHQPRAAVDEGG